MSLAGQGIHNLCAQCVVENTFDIQKHTQIYFQVYIVFQLIVLPDNHGGMDVKTCTGSSLPIFRTKDVSQIGPKDLGVKGSSHEEES